MATAGSAKLWAGTFSPGLIPQIVNLVLTSWEVFPKPGRRDKEVPITRKFRSFVKKRKNELRDLPVRIMREVVEDDPDTAEERGRIDIQFTEAGNCREDVYFAFECKRLNVATKAGGRRSLAREYVQQGMMRFINSQYAPGLRHGGMAGFVLDGDAAAAIDAVSRCAKKARRALKTKAPGTLCESLLVRGQPLVKETFHDLRGRLFRIQHVFLPV